MSKIFVPGTIAKTRVYTGNTKTPSESDGRTLQSQQQMFPGRRDRLWRRGRHFLYMVRAAQPASRSRIRQSPQSSWWRRWRWAEIGSSTQFSKLSLTDLASRASTPGAADHELFLASIWRQGHHSMRRAKIRVTSQSLRKGYGRLHVGDQRATKLHRNLTDLCAVT